MVTKKAWKEFRATGLVWFINTILHMFGWAIVCDVEPDENGKITDDCEVLDVYPARVKFRGFGNESTTNGYIKVSEYMVKESSKLLEEAKK